MMILMRDHKNDSRCCWRLVGFVKSCNVPTAWNRVIWLILSFTQILGPWINVYFIQKGTSSKGMPSIVQNLIQFIGLVQAIPIFFEPTDLFSQISKLSALLYSLFFWVGAPPSWFPSWAQGRHTNSGLVALSAPRGPTLSRTVCPSPPTIESPVRALNDRLRCGYYL